MPTNNDERRSALEESISFLDRRLDQLDEALRDVASRLDRFDRRVARLESELDEVKRESAAGDADGPGSSDDEYVRDMPPHAARAPYDRPADPSSES